MGFTLKTVLIMMNVKDDIGHFYGFNYTEYRSLNRDDRE